MNKVKILSIITGGLLAFIGVGALVCGLMLILEPDGGSIGLPLELLEHSPFEDFFIPGIALFAINGIGSIIGALLVFKKHRYAGLASMFLGVAMIIWILAETYWYEGDSFLQPAMFSVGVVEIVFGFFLNSQHTEK